MISRLKNLFNDTIWFVSSIVEKKNLIKELSKKELKSKYTDSYLGAVWLFLEPILFIAVLWFVFGIGLRGGRGGEIPFIVYLSIGIVSWRYFAENLNKGCGLIKSYSFLVKKVDFRLSILPIVLIISSSVIHVALLLFVFLIMMANNVLPSFFIIQLFYYYFAMALLLLGLVWLTSALSVFVPDIKKIVSVFVQFGFFLTPVFWKVDRLPELYVNILSLNPMFYIVHGYRDSLIYDIPFWEKPFQTIYFWSFTLFVLLLGAIVFKRLRPHFAAVVQ